MPSEKVITPILGSSYYHIFNRGINRQKIFFSERNYFYFLQLIDNFLLEYISVLAYCLLPNHFHIIVKVNEKNIVEKKEGIPSLQKDGILNQLKKPLVSAVHANRESKEISND